MDQVVQVREKTDVVALIGEHIPLKRMGRNFKALCPFHNEQTPSFVVSPERQIWHCFGCGKGGDVFTFLMEYETLEFPEALRMLAKQAGIELSTSAVSKGTSSKRESMFALNRIAADFYHYILTKHPAGKKALTYLTETRGISEKLINTFFLGLAPYREDVLVNYLLKKKGYKKEDLVDIGLATYRYGRIGDFFTNRIMFPLFDHRGNIVGFSARTLDDSKNIGSKYINTRDTFIYHKGSVFYGLHITKEEIKKTGRAILMEGEFDVISAFGHGICNVVAVKGTALTENQVVLISRFAQKISLCFDQDAAGKEAIKRSLPLLEKRGLTTTIVLLKGKDPDEALKKDAFSFKKAIKEDINVYDYLLEEILSSVDVKTSEGKKKMSEEILPFFAQIENEIVKEHYLKKLSTALDTSYESISRQVEKMKKKDVTSPIFQKTTKKRDRDEVLEEYLLALLLQLPNHKENMRKAEEVLAEIKLAIPAHEKIFNKLRAYLATHQSFEVKQFAASLPSEIMASFDTCFLYPLPKFSDAHLHPDEIIKVAQELKTLSVRKRIESVSWELKQKEDIDEDEKTTALKQELSHLVSLLQST